MKPIYHFGRALAQKYTVIIKVNTKAGRKSISKKSRLVLNPWNKVLPISLSIRNGMAAKRKAYCFGCFLIIHKK